MVFEFGKARFMIGVFCILHYHKMQHNMNIELKESFDIVEEGAVYKLPEYKVMDGVEIEPTGNNVELRFVRGSKVKDEEVEKREGTLHEHLISAMIYDLKYKNGLAPSREGALTITNLEQALGWMRHRSIDRVKRDVQGTCQK